MTRLALITALVALAFPTLAREAVWIEGEAAAGSSCARHSWYHNVKRELLSGSDWLSHYSNRGAGEAEWTFTVKEGGTYNLWLLIAFPLIFHIPLVD